MFRIRSKNFIQNFKFNNGGGTSVGIRWQSKNALPNLEIPKTADVVVIGGGSAGCHTLYHLTKRGIKAVLLERAKLTAGTTWHTAGLVWRLRPNDVDIELLASSRNMLMSLEQETELDPGWIQNGGIFIAHSETRLDEYKRLASIGKSLNIENHILDPKETQKIFPLINEKSFIGSLYSPGDGVVDPAMLCAALTKASTAKGGKVLENCPVNEILVENGQFGSKKVIGVSTPYGTIATNTVVNATGVWGKDLIEKHGTILPLLPMKHAYIVSETIPGIRGMPNIRDHDYSIYFRIQGDSICMGGYENNPIILDKIPNDFNFGLYDLDWEVFDAHVQGAVELCPAFGAHGIKSTICGPESFTPDHKPLMGPDTNVKGIYHNCGFNSAGMMLGGGCGEQTALWIINGQPELPMFQFDLHRFTNKQCKHIEWMKERSHESYVKNYSMVFPHDQPLGGRNFKKDPIHDDMLSYNAFMEEKQGWERPGFFMSNNDGRVDVLPYDWYGSYEFKRQNDSPYEKCLDGDLKYQFSDYHDLIGNEALACRNNAVLFNMSYFSKMYLDGPDAEQAANWIFTANTKRDINKTVYTCALNNQGGVEADVTISRIESGNGAPHNPKTTGVGYYIVAGGASSYYTYHNILSEINRKGFNATLKDVTEDLGVLSIQGPNSRNILQKVTDFELTDTALPMNSSNLVNIIVGKENYNVRVLRVSFVGELGYELHVPKEYCSKVYKHLMEIGKVDDLRNAGYRALYSLSSEKGYHLWGFDLRSNDTPMEANLLFTCRKNGLYKGKDVIDRQRIEGIKKRLVYFTLDDHIPLWGLEGVYRNGEPVGFLRRGEYAYTLGKSFGQAYLKRLDEKPIDAAYIKSGTYQIDIMGKLYSAQCHLRSPFDPEGKRVMGIYK